MEVPVHVVFIRESKKTDMFERRLFTKHEPTPADMYHIYLFDIYNGPIVFSITSFRIGEDLALRARRHWLSLLLPVYTRYPHMHLYAWPSAVGIPTWNSLR